MNASLPDLVRDRWATLLRDGAFTVTEESHRLVVLASAGISIRVGLDPRGELNVAVYPHGREPWEGWSYVGMVGAATAARVLELALDEMHAEPKVLRGDPVFYAALADGVEADVEQWTAYYSGTGPRPGNRHLP